MKGIDIIENEFSNGYGICRPDGKELHTLFDCSLCTNHPRINKLMFYIHFSMENDGSRIAALSYVRNKLNDN